MDIPAISVVIPAYNADLYLRRSVDSALSQTCKPLEIIVVDDGSTDGTAKIARTYGDAIRYLYGENGGAAAARNTGIRAAQGDWIAFLDVDDEWRCHHLENAVKVLRNHPELKWYGAPVDQYIHETGKRILAYRERKPGILIDGAYFDDYMVAFPPYAHLGTSTMVIHKSIFHAVGMFDEGNRSGSEDLDLWFRIGLHFPKVGYCHQVASNKYERATSLSHANHSNVRGTLASFKDREALAESLGEDARRRAEPRIMHWVTKLLKSSLSRGDTAAVREIYAIYKHRLSPRWRWLAWCHLAAPWALSAGFCRARLHPGQAAVVSGKWASINEEYGDHERTP